MSWQKEILTHLRCPDCLGKVSPCAEGFRCGACGRELALYNNLLLGLPRELAPREEANRAHFDAIAGSEESELARRTKTRNHRRKMDMVVDCLKLRDCETSCRVLELGAGLGDHGTEICKLGHAYTAIDISPGLLRQAAQRYDALDSALLVAADAARIPLEDGLFDAVFCVATLHHLPDPEEGVREALRLLKPGGRYCFLEPKRFYPSVLLQYLRFPETEVSVMKMTVPNATHWVRAGGASQVCAGYCVYTPNGPRVLLGVWKAIDRLCESVSALHVASVMFCIYGTK